MCQEEIAEIFFKNLSLFKLTEFLSVGDQKYLFSHAGIIPEWLKLHFDKINLSETENLSNLLNEQLNDLDKFKKFVTEALMDRSASRCGTAIYPSVVWADVADYKYQENRLPDVYQIFGHTQQESAPVITDYYANLDCRKAFLLLDNGVIEKMPA